MGLTRDAVVRADWQLWWPGWNPSLGYAVTAANELGVDANGRTTWEILQGTADGPSTIPSDYTSMSTRRSIGFHVALTINSSSVTIVAGASDVSYAFTDTNYNVGGGQYCTMNGAGVGVCEDALYGGASAATYTITTVTAAIDVVWTPAPAPAAVKRTEPSETTLATPTPPPSRMKRVRDSA